MSTHNIMSSLSFVNSKEINFHKSMIDSGVLCRENIIIDGVLHRFANGGKGSKSGWYVCHGEYGAFGDWKKSLSFSWTSKDNKELSFLEKQQLHQQIETAKNIRLEEEKQKHINASLEALSIFNGASIEGTSLYLTRKGVKGHNIKYNEHSILVPMQDVHGALWSLQTIFNDGIKSFLKNGRKKGCFHLLGKIGNEIYVCEGYATGVSIYETTGIATVIAFDSGNLEPVIASIKEKYPNISITITADNDIYSTKNIGKDSAERVAERYNCKLIFPVFKDLTTKPTDFNDLMALEGGDAVQLILNGENLPQLKTQGANEFPSELLKFIPGLPGQIAAWINDTSVIKQPVLALGAALAVSSIIYARRIKSETDARTNLMILGIADSGRGKDHSLKCIKRLLKGVGLERYILGEFASDTGFIKSLQRNKGIGISIMDEVGEELKALNNKNSGGYESRILTIMTKLFSCANDTYYGKEYANHDGKMPRIDLLQPCFVAYGVSTPDNFYESLTQGSIANGFLPRWLTFKIPTKRPPKTKALSSHIIPQNLINAMGYIETNLPINEIDNPNGFYGEKEPNPTTIRFNDMALIELKKLEEICERESDIEIEKGGKLAAIWERTVEHAIKIALVAHSYEGGVIEGSVMSWASNLVLYLTREAVLAARDNISDNDCHKQRNQILGVITRFYDKNKRPMKNFELSNNLWNITLHERADALAYLVESEKIETFQSEYKGKISKSYKPI